MRRLLSLLAAMTILVSPMQFHAQSKTSSDAVRRSIERHKCGDYLRLTLVTDEKINGIYLPYIYDPYISDLNKRRYHGDQFTFVVSLKPPDKVYRVLSYSDVKEVKSGRSLKEKAQIALAAVEIAPFL